MERIDVRKDGNQEIREKERKHHGTDEESARGWGEVSDQP